MKSEATPKSRFTDFSDSFTFLICVQAFVPKAVHPFSAYVICFGAYLFNMAHKAGIQRINVNMRRPDMDHADFCLTFVFMKTASCSCLRMVPPGMEASLSFYEDDAESVTLNWSTMAFSSFAMTLVSTDRAAMDSIADDVCSAAAETSLVRPSMSWIASVS